MGRVEFYLTDVDIDPIKTKKINPNESRGHFHDAKAPPPPKMQILFSEFQFQKWKNINQRSQTHIDQRTTFQMKNDPRDAI